MQNNDFSTANKTLGFIEDPEVLSLARDAVSAAQREDKLWQQNPRNESAWVKADRTSTSSWADLDRQSTDSWADLDRQATSEWARIYEQSSDHCHPA